MIDRQISALVLRHLFLPTASVRRAMIEIFNAALWSTGARAAGYSDILARRGARHIVRFRAGSSGPSVIACRASPRSRQTARGLGLRGSVGVRRHGRGDRQPEAHIERQCFGGDAEIALHPLDSSGQPVEPAGEGCFARVRVVEDRNELTAASTIADRGNFS